MSAPREMQSCCRRWHSAIRREEESKVTGAGVLCQRHHHHRSSTHRLVVGEPYFSLVTLHSGVENVINTKSASLFCLYSFSVWWSLARSRFMAEP
ncbi:hypothetical protein YC2023_060496 [Brassica napus]